MRKIITIWVGIVAFISVSFGQEKSTYEADSSNNSFINVYQTITSSHNNEMNTSWQNTTTNKSIAVHIQQSNTKESDYLKQFREKLEEAKRNNGKEFNSDGKLKLAVNTSCLEAYYQIYNQIDTLTWADLLQSWQSESIYDLYQSYVNYKYSESSLSEIKNYLAEKYKERENTGIKTDLKPDDNSISNVEIEDP